MRVENFIYFFTICGFFIGLVFSVINFDMPEYILFYTLLITFFFYLLIHISIAGFMDIKNLSKKIFDKKKYEEQSDYFIFELENREKRINSLVTVMENIENQKAENNRENRSDDKIAA